MKNFKIIISLIVLLGAMSCRKEIPETNRPDDYFAEDFASVFEGFWTGMNNNYAFWDIDPTDWDEIYKIYQPKFAALDINKSEDHSGARQYFREMTKDLIDGHYILHLKNGYSIQPILDRHRQNPDYHDSNLLRYYINNNLPARYLRSGYITNYSVVLSAILGKVKDTEKNILYFRFDGFRFTDLLAYNNDFFETLASAFSDPTLDGVIIDVRSNGGGLVSDLDILWGSFLLGGERLIGYRREKIGEGRLDYGPRIPFKIRPYDNPHTPANPHPVTAPIVVLADVNSGSAAEISTMLLSHLPNGYFVGETTWGGQGVLSRGTLMIYNAGIFETSYFSMIYTPFCIVEAENGQCYEGRGFSPKDAPRGYEVKFDAAALSTGRDPQLEKAIEVVETN